MAFFAVILLVYPAIYGILAVTETGGNTYQQLVAAALITYVLIISIALQVSALQNYLKKQAQPKDRPFARAVDQFLEDLKKTTTDE